MQNLKGYSSAVSILAVVALLMSAFALVIADDSSADSTYTVTDGKGNTVEFETVPEHVVAIGVGLNATIVSLDCVDKLVVVDKYTKTNTSEIFADLHDAITAGDILANGTIYASGKDALVADIVSATDDGKFDAKSDVILITGSDTYVPPIVDTLRTYGYQKILVWNDITDYSDIADFVDSVSMAITGETSQASQDMKDLAATIDSKLEGKERAEAFYVTYSSNTFKVGNTGSLANSMIIAAGGISVTVDESKTSSTYEASITELIEAHPGVVIFADNTILSNEANMEKFLALIDGGDYACVLYLDALWNNYSPVSMEGVEAMADTMYPGILNDDPVDPVEPSNIFAMIVQFFISIIRMIMSIFGF